MKVRAVVRKEDTIDITLVQNDDEVVVMAGDWSLIIFRIDEDGKLVFAHSSAVEDDRILTTDDGLITEVDE